MSGDPDCQVCHGRDLGTTDGPTGEQIPVVCGACTELPVEVLTALRLEEDLEDD